MPAQYHIIQKVNRIFQANKEDFRFNRDGVCSGLSALYVKYALEDREDVFFRLVEKINGLPNDYQIGEDSLVEQFFQDVERYFQPEKYSGGQIAQSDTEKYVDINSMPIRNEFNIGLIASASQWESIFSKIKRDHRVADVRSHNHVVNIKFMDGKFTVYDSNYECHFKTFANEADLLKEIAECFDISPKEMGLSVRVFSNPTKSYCTSYPSHDSLYQALAENNFTGLITTADKTKLIPANFASIANDPFTLNKILSSPDFFNIINYATPSTRQNSFIDAILQMPKSDLQQALLARAIKINFAQGNCFLLNQVLEKYQTNNGISQETAEIAGWLVDALKALSKPEKDIFLRIDDYSKILEFCTSVIPATDREPFSKILLNLQLLTLLHESKEKISEAIAGLDGQALLEQIQWAACRHQHLLLRKLLIRQAELSNKEPLFNQEVAQNIDTESMRILLSSGIEANSDQLATFCYRNNRLLLDLYLRAVEHSGHTIKMPSALFENIGNVSRLAILMALGEDEFIKQNWPKNTPSDEELLQALKDALLASSETMVQFIKEKRDLKGLKTDTSEFTWLFDDAFGNENLSQLKALSCLGLSLYPSEPRLNKKAFMERLDLIHQAYQETDNLDVLTRGLSALNPEKQAMVFNYILATKNEKP